MCVQAHLASDRLPFGFLVRWGGDPGWNVTDGLGCLSITIANCNWAITAARANSEMQDLAESCYCQKRHLSRILVA